MNLVQDVKSRTDIVDVVSDYVPLQKAGRSFKAQCPFHSEKTPSFFVFPERQTWRCFGGCAVGGDLISFIMKAETLEFGEALNRLAQRAGVAIPSRQTRVKDDLSYQLNDVAVDFFRRVLHSQEGQTAREYLAKRGINQEAEGMFQLGLSPGGRDTLTRHLLGQGYPEQDIISAGLASKDEGGAVRDQFHRRLMFPIADASGHLVGFGGRTLDTSNPKYLNTSRTQVFDKGRLLYGLPLARDTIGRTGTVVIVEGYMDVIAAHQHGFHNVVASMGTALTEHQVSALKNLASEFVLALDPDNAGQEATRNSLETSWKALQIDFLRSGGRSGVVFTQRHLSASLKIASLPTGKDPDALIREDTQEWTSLVSEAKPLLDYLFEALPPRFDVTNDAGKLQLVDILSPFIRAEGNPFTQRRYIRRLADTASLSEADLEAHMWRPQRRVSTNGRRAETTTRANSATLAKGSFPGKATHRDMLEEYCLYLLISYPELKEGDLGISLDFFEQSENRDIFTRWVACSTIEDLEGDIPLDLAEQLQAILSTDAPPLDVRVRPSALEEVANRLKERSFKLQEQALLEQLEGVDWTDAAKLEAPSHQAQEINQQLKQIYSS